MPIAICTLSRQVPVPLDSERDVTKLWREAAGLDCQEMTVMVTQSAAVYGNIYDVIAQLHLPSVWSEANQILLQESLASALSSWLSLSPNRIFILTTILPAGRVVEGGETQRW